MDNNFTKIYILRDHMKKEEMEKILKNSSVMYLTRDEMEEFFEDYTAEEIRDMINGNCFYLSSIPIIYNYLYSKKENKKEEEIKVYSEFLLPIETGHKLVSMGIRTTYDLIMKSERELENLNEFEIELIEAELECRGLCLKESKYDDRIKTIDYYLEELEIKRNNHREELRELNEKMNTLIEIMKNEKTQIEELEAEREEIEHQKTYKKIRN
ncbi:MAG: hypothetical protein IKG27_00240 [Bacilli bacterium]|nr:hypothetical protein [Bacilli bacterium]